MTSSSPRLYLAHPNLTPTKRCTIRINQRKCVFSTRVHLRRRFTVVSPTCGLVGVPRITKVPANDLVPMGEHLSDEPTCCTDRDTWLEVEAVGQCAAHLIRLDGPLVPPELHAEHRGLLHEPMSNVQLD